MLAPAAEERAQHAPNEATTDLAADGAGGAFDHGLGGAFSVAAARTGGAAEQAPEQSAGA